MKFKDFISFKKQFESVKPLVSLIISSEARHLSRKLLPSQHVSIDSDSFSPRRFMDEVESISLFEPKRFVYVEIDSLNAEELASILNYLKSPNPKTTLLLSAQTLASSSKIFKEIDRQGDILNLADEKPWDKEKDLINRAIGFAKIEGFQLDILEAKKLVNHLNKDPVAIENELKKIFCFVHPRKKIVSQDLDQIFFEKQTHTLWQLGDSLFTQPFSTLFEQLQSLLDEGTSIFPILAHFKNQFRNACLALNLYQEEGIESVLKLFPYYKEQKMQIYKSHGLAKIKQGYLETCHCEVKAKNSVATPDLLLELLIEKLCSIYCPTS